MGVAKGHQGDGHRILVVDDEHSICRMVAKVVQGAGYVPVVCHHPREALEAAQSEMFPLAFLDIRLPEMSGLELAAKLKESNPLLEMVFMTGYGTIENAVEAIKVGAYDFLRKPFNISELKLCIRRFQEREALKEKIRLAEGRYFQLVQHIPLVIFVLRKDFQLDFINEACSKILGFGPEEAVHVEGWLLERMHPDDRPRIESLFQSAFESGATPFSAECRFHHKKGQILHTIVKSIPRLEQVNGMEAEQLEGIVVDITDRVFLEKSLVQKEKLKTLGAISAEVAHEIRNPLVSLGGFARRLQKKYPQTPEIDIILNESQRLEKILDRIKNYLKPLEIRPRECSVNEVLTNCFKLLSSEADSPEAAGSSLDLDSQLPLAYIDPDILSEVFINLIRKGEENIRKGGRLTVRTFESGENVHVEFRNEGGGLKIRDQEELFLPFDEGGESIGLSLSYRLLKNMGGVLSFNQDESLVVFTVTLPKTVRPEEEGTGD